MVAMGGGPEVPSKTGSKDKELVLAVLPWPAEQCKKGIKELEKEFDNIKVQHYYSHFDNGKVTVDDIPDGTYSATDIHACCTASRYCKSP
jgi:hypothetical protein